MKSNAKGSHVDARVFTHVANERALGDARAMRRPIWICAVAVVGLLGCRQLAAGAEITGISDQNMVVWSLAAHDAFERINVPHVRYITAWDVALHKNDNPCGTACQRFYELRDWISVAQSLGKEVLISFGDQVGCNGCTPPTASQYAAGINRFLEEVRDVRVFTAWNEPNHRGHVTPGLAAQYWKVLNQSCQFITGNQCTVAAGDLNEVGNYRQYTSDYKNALSAIGAPAPPVWAIHPYAAVSSGNFGTLLSWIHYDTEGRPVWFTEVGAFYCSAGGLAGGSPTEALNFQNGRAGVLNALLAQVPARVERTYYYFLAKPHGQEESCPGFDTALFGAGDTERPAFATLFPDACDCDDGNACTSDMCAAGECLHDFAPQCLAPILSVLLDRACGDDSVDADEQCDDGNLLNGDCCSANCRFEAAGTLCGMLCGASFHCDGAGTCH